MAGVTITVPGGGTTTTVVNIAGTAPGIFTANMTGEGPYAGQVVYAHADASHTVADSTVLSPSSNTFAPNPIHLGVPGDQVYLVLYGTGIRHADSLTATINGVSVPTIYLGGQGSYPGLDQINLGPLPASLAGLGVVNLIITPDDQTQTAARVLGAPAETAGPKHPRVEGQSTLEEYLAAAQRVVLGGTVRQLRIPPAPGRPVTARLWLPGDLAEKGSTRVSLEAGTARVLAVDRPGEQPLARRIVQAAMPLHYGEWGGIAVRVLWCFIGLMPTVLFLSGVMMWWGPFRARRRAAQIAAAATRVPEGDLVA
jgi:hypothetical protein